MTTTKMTDDELTIALEETLPGSYWGPTCLFNKHREIIARPNLNGDLKVCDPYNNYAHSKDAIERNIFPVIRERGLWTSFIEKLSGQFWWDWEEETDTWEHDLMTYLLTLPARTLAEKCLEVLRDE